MFTNINKIFVLSMGNHLDSCREDVKKLKVLLKNKGDFVEIYDCNPQEEILRFIKNKKFEYNDLVIIHYSGHGRFVGRQINGKMEMISTWLHANEKTHSYSNDIDFILSSLNCRILLISDSCHSGKFGDFFTGKNPYIFIGSSSITNQSTEYLFKNNEKKTGALVNLFEYILIKIPRIDKLNLLLLQTHVKKFYEENKIKIKPVIKGKNI